MLFLSMWNYNDSQLFVIFILNLILGASLMVNQYLFHLGSLVRPAIINIKRRQYFDVQIGC